MDNKIYHNIAQIMSTSAATIDQLKDGWAVLDVNKENGIPPNKTSESEILHNPMMAFWLRAKLFYNHSKKLSEEGNILHFEDYAFIISDLGQSLYMLMGRHWNIEAKEKYSIKVGPPPLSTPDLLALLEKYYPKIGWNLPQSNNDLWNNLHDFILNYYQDIIKHFDFSKFQKAVELNLEHIDKFMEITRQTWIWFIEQLFEIKYDIKNVHFKEFNTKYFSL